MLAAAVGGVTSAAAQNTVFNFNNADGNGAYTDAFNWDQGTVPDLKGTDPNTGTSDTAVIGDGAAVTYTPGGDLIIAGGGILEVTSGSFTQVTGNNYFQLEGNGTLLVNGGTFNQGTASSTPFNVTNTGNAFTITSGAANFSSNFNIPVGLAFSQSGGTVTVTGNETDFDNNTATLSGGTLVTNLITGVNGGADSFTISGGTLNLTGATAIYGGGTTQYINFTPGSNGIIRFTSTSSNVNEVDGFVKSGAIEYNSGGGGTAALANFNIVQNGTEVDLSLISSLQGSVPEPSTYAMLGTGVAAGCAVLRRRRK